MRIRFRLYIAIQLVPSDWFDEAARRQRCAAIEHADVVQAEEAALKHVAPFRVLPIHPPGEVQHQLVKDALEKLESPGSSFFVSRRRLRSIWNTRQVAQPCTVD